MEAAPGKVNPEGLPTKRLKLFFFARIAQFAQYFNPFFI